MTAISDRTAATTNSTDGVSTDKPATKPRPGALAATGRPTVRPPAAAHLSDEQVAELGRELDAIKDEILAKRGASDAAYIRRVIKIQRGLEIAGRADAAGEPEQGRLDHGNQPAQPRQDPGKHGDRPQHPPRPVGLDA
jgi:hypothetical protein